jgi:hypothetical protein
VIHAESKNPGVGRRPAMARQIRSTSSSAQTLPLALLREGGRASGRLERRARPAKRLLIFAGEYLASCPRWGSRALEWTASWELKAPTTPSPVVVYWQSPQVRVEVNDHDAGDTTGGGHVPVMLHVP